MTTKKQKDLESFLTLYLFAWEEVRRAKDCTDWVPFLMHNELHYGMCNAIDFIEERDGYKIAKSWINKYVGKYNLFIAPVPRVDIANRAHVSKALQARIDCILKELNQLN